MLLAGSVLLNAYQVVPPHAPEPSSTIPAPRSNAFFNDSDRKGHYVFFVHDAAGTCADFQAGRLVDEASRRLVITIDGLAEGQHQYSAEDSSVWCYSVIGAARRGIVSGCAAGDLSIVSVEEARHVVGDYRFRLQDGHEMQGPLSALYCPFAE